MCGAVSETLVVVHEDSNNDGCLDVERSAIGIEVKVDAKITDIDGEAELVEGSFSLSFE